MRPRLGGQCDRKSRGGRFLFLTSVLNESSRQHKFDSQVDGGPTKSKTPDKNSTRIGLGKSARIRWISALSSTGIRRNGPACKKFRQIGTGKRPYIESSGQLPRSRLLEKLSGNGEPETASPRRDLNL